MTAKNRNKTNARKLQAGTGRPYATCLQAARDAADRAARRPDTSQAFADAGSNGPTADDAYVMALAETHLRWLAEDAADRHGLPWTVQPTWNMAPADVEPNVVMHVPGAPYQLEVNFLDGYGGWMWRHVESGGHAPMGNFLHDGVQVTSDYRTWDDTTAATVAEAVDWLAGRYAAHPDGWTTDDGPDRPAAVQPPIWN